MLYILYKIFQEKGKCANLRDLGSAVKRKGGRTKASADRLAGGKRDGPRGGPLGPSRLERPASVGSAQVGLERPASGIVPEAPDGLFLNLAYALSR